MKSSTTAAVRGAYGLALFNLPAAAPLLVPAAESWVTWRIRHQATSVYPANEALSPDRARLRLSGEGWVAIDRQQRTSTLLLPQRPADSEIVHPYLSLTAAVSARWRGWNCFHAGCLVVDGGAWGLLGKKGAGKSSCLATFVLELGADVLADDVLVVDDQHRGLAGPRCLDLREETARHYGVGEALGVVGARERWRIPMRPIQPDVPLRGFVQLAWGDHIEFTALRPSERFEALARGFALKLLPPDVESLMSLISLPVWRFSRPRCFDRMGESALALQSELRADSLAPRAPQATRDASA